LGQDGGTATSKKIHQDIQTLCTVTNPVITQETRGGLDSWHPLFPMASQQILDPLSGHTLCVAWILDGQLERADLVPGGCACECETVNVAE